MGVTPDPNNPQGPSPNNLQIFANPQVQTNPQVQNNS